MDWFKGPWKEYLLDEISSSSFNNCDLIDSNELAKQIRKITSPDNNDYVFSEYVWTQLSPYLWYKYFLNQN